MPDGPATRQLFSMYGEYFSLCVLSLAHAARVQTHLGLSGGRGVEAR